MTATSSIVEPSRERFARIGLNIEQSFVSSVGHPPVLINRAQVLDSVARSSVADRTKAEKIIEGKVTQGFPDDQSVSDRREPLSLILAKFIQEELLDTRCRLPKFLSLNLRKSFMKRQVCIDESVVPFRISQEPVELFDHGLANPPCVFPHEGRTFLSVKSVPDSDRSLLKIHSENRIFGVKMNMQILLVATEIHSTPRHLVGVLRGYVFSEFVFRIIWVHRPNFGEGLSRNLKPDSGPALIGFLLERSHLPQHAHDLLELGHDILGRLNHFISAIQTGDGLGRAVETGENFLQP
jgi:hypothetical protein